MKKTGKLFGIPFDWRRPTGQRIRQRAWNPQDRRVFTPKSFGWGYSINFHELARRLGLIRRR
ncbi:MAG TPA: DUF5808 domain-containing protein [Chloroflexota bacterium]|jgi:hypothetical protein|nr:DUF5808 domain-containing protein [Chloroflexota bacterium]